MQPRTGRHRRIPLPLPAQFLMESSDLVTMPGTQVHYRLIGLWPINPRNAPQRESEKSGLESLLTHPEQTVTGTVTYGKGTYFQTI